MFELHADPFWGHLTLTMHMRQFDMFLFIAFWFEKLETHDEQKAVFIVKEARKFMNKILEHFPTQAKDARRHWRSKEDASAAVVRGEVEDSDESGSDVE